MTNRMHNDPEADVEISTAYRGDLRCRKLTVTKTGSIVGNVEAVDVRNFGRIHGVVNASLVFINAEGARFRGHLFSPEIGNHPKARLEGSTSNSYPFAPDSMPGQVTQSAINRAVQEGIQREMAKRGLASDDQGFSVSENTTFARPQKSAEPGETRQFRTADGKLHDYQSSENAEPVEFIWVPPAPSRNVFADGKELHIVSVPAETAPVVAAPSSATPRQVPTGPRPLPPLFSIGK